MFVTLPRLLVLNALTPNAGNDDTCRRRLAAGELVLKEKPLVTIVTPHTPKTLARYVAELRQKVTITTVKIESVAQWTLSESHLLRLYIGVFQPSQSPQ